MNKSKHCNKCDTTKPLTDFYKRGERGYQPKCKDCQRAYRMGRRDIDLANKRQHYLKNKNKWRKYADRTAEEKAAVIARVKAWRIANPERYKKQMDNWRAANPHVHNARSRERTARKRGNGVFTITRGELARIYRSACIYCGSMESITVEHVLPIARGGRHSIGNIAPACRRCNLSKKDRTVMEWRMGKRKAPTA